MKVISYLLFPLSFLLVSCSGDEDRITNMTQELNIVLPNSYKQIENKVDGGIDFTITVELGFSESDIKLLSDQIRNSLYFNSEIKNDANSKYSKLLKDNNLRGLWLKTNRGYKFIDHGPKSESISAELDTIEYKLSYELIHL